MNLLVLAAGYATRLYPLTRDRPKALLPVGGRPMADWLLERLEPIGFDSKYLVTNARFAGNFREWAEGSEVTVVDDGTTSDEDRLGAIGDIGFVIEQEGLDDDLVVVAGDNLFSEPLGDFGRVARERGAPLLAVHDVGDLELVRGRYNSIEVDARGRDHVLRGEAGRATLDAVRHRPVLLSTGDAATGPRVPRRRKQPRSARATHPVALPARGRLHLARARAVVRHRRPRTAGGSRPRLFTELTQRRRGAGRTVGGSAGPALPESMRRLPTHRGAALRGVSRRLAARPSAAL